MIIDSTSLIPKFTEGNDQDGNVSVLIGHEVRSLIQLGRLFFILFPFLSYSASGSSSAICYFFGSCNFIFLFLFRFFFSLVF
jgi:hypothetical protein